MEHDRMQISALLRLNQLPLAGRREITDRLLAGEAPAEIEARILAGPNPGGAERLAAIRKKFDPAREAEQCLAAGIRLVAVTDPDYPEALRRIFHPPWVLYLRGCLLPEDRAAAAIVGTRHPSYYGREQTRRFARGLSEAGLTVVSGLAKGVDQTAHEAAMEISYGRTLAVLGSGVDLCYPKENQKLYERIPEQGAVLSEYPLGTPPLARHFPERNRILAGLAAGTLVVEAHYRSGALITAHEAADEGREVFAVPGPVDQLTSRGTHRLLKEGALLAENPEDLLELLLPVFQRAGWLSGKRPESAVENVPDHREIPIAVTREEVPGRSPADGDFLEDERQILERLSGGPRSSEELLEDFPDGTAASVITRLEILGRIRKRPDGLFEAACNSGTKKG